MNAGTITGLIVLVLGALLLWRVFVEDKKPNTLPGTSGKLGALLLIAMVACALMGVGAIVSLVSFIIGL